MITGPLNLKLVEEGRDLKYIEGFYAGMEYAYRGMGKTIDATLNNPAFERGPADCEFLLAEKRRKKEGK